MSKFIRALALFSLTIGLAGCLHSDDDTVFITLPPVDGGGGVNELIAGLVTDPDAAPEGSRPATDETLGDAAGRNPGFPFVGYRLSALGGARSAQVGIVDSNSDTQTRTNIIYSPRADLGLVDFDGEGNRLGGRVIPQIAAYEVINARVDNRRYAYYDREDIPFEEVDSDNDGTVDFRQVDSDDDGMPDFEDTDDNNDGTLDVDELAADFPDANSNGVNDLVEAGIADFNDVAYFTEQGAMMQFAALAYWIDSPSDALDFSAEHSLSEIGAGVFGLETAAANLPRGIASYRGTMHGIYRKSGDTLITTGFTIRPDVAANRDTTLLNDEVYPVILRTGAQNYLVEGPVNVTAEFALGRIDGGFTAMAYEPNYRLDYTPESLADYDPTAERNDETFGQWLGNGRYYLPNRGGLRVAPAGIIAIPTIPVLDPVSGSPTFDINGIPIRADAVVLPTTTALDANGNPIRAMVDGSGPIVDPAAQIAIRYSPLSGTIRPNSVSCTSGIGCMTNAGSTCTPSDSGCTRSETVWEPDDDAALAIRRSLANTLPDPFTRLPAPVPVIPSVLQGQFSGSIDRSVDDGEFTGEFTGTTSIGVSVTTTGRTVARDVSEVVFATRASIIATNNANPDTFTFGFHPRTDRQRTLNQPGDTRNINQLVPLRRRNLDRDGNVIGIEPVTNDDGDALFIVIRTASRQVPETTEEAIEPTGVFSPLADATGDIFGQFFGPNGEETAGSGNLQNGQNELVFTFGGRQIGLIPPDTLAPEDAAQIAEQTRLNGRYDELVSLILPDFERTDAPAFSPVLNNQRLTNIDAFNEEQTENALRLFYPATVPIEDIRILNELSRTFRMNSGIVDDPMVLDMIDPTGRLTP